MRRTKMSLVLAPLFAVSLLIGASSYVSANQNPYLILHFDGISSQRFFRELEEGNLPNIERAFEGGGLIRHGLTLFPGATEIIVPRLFTGQSNSEHPIVGWSYIDAETGKVVPQIRVFFDMLQQMPRRTVTSIIHGIPPLESFASISLINTPRLLDQYGFVVFYWFATDATAHYLGEEAYRNSIYNFDRSLGQLLDSTDLSQVNLVLYTDHGMVLDGVYTVDLDKLVAEAIGEYVAYADHPNIYLKDGACRDQTARILVERDIYDLALYLDDPDTLVGYTRMGRFTVHGQDGRTNYSFDDGDFFGYGDLGYLGEYLDRYEWLDLTKETRYPGAIPNLYGYAQNPNSGDLVVILNPPRIPKTIWANQANHAGITDEDLMVPVLLKGPDLKDLYDMDTMWLHELFTVHLGSGQSLSVRPRREENSLTLWIDREGYSGYSASFSPTYRLRIAGEISEYQTSMTLLYDVFSSFITRLWVGPSFTGSSGLYKGEIRAELEVRVGDLGLRYAQALTATSKGTLTLFADVSRDLSLKLRPEGSFGLSYRF